MCRGRAAQSHPWVVVGVVVMQQAPTYHPQLYTWLWLLLTATVYSAPQCTLLIALSCRLATASGTSRSFESP